MAGREVESEPGRSAARLAPMAPEAQGEFRALAEQLEDGLDALSAATRERLHETLPTWMSDTIFAEEEIVGFIRASLGAQLCGFRRGVLPERSPHVDAVGAQVVAEVGELKLLLSGYRVAQMSLWDAWLELVEGSVDSAGERQQLLRHGSEYFFRYAGLLSDYVADIYQRELEQSVRSGEQRRVHAIRALLEGGSLVGAQLDVDLEQHHVGVVAWGEEGRGRPRAGRGARPPAADDRAAEQELVGLDQRHTRARSFSGGGSEALPAGRLGAARDRARGLRRSGLPRHQPPGPEGPRWIARNLDRPVVHYGDVAVEALASENHDDARAFVANELRGIDDDSPTSQRIRETIVAYFAADHNAASAAAALGIHHQTVANRLRVAEERLGHPVGARRVELETALRLRLCLGSEAA